MTNSRRDFIKKGAMLAASGIVGSALADSLANNSLAGETGAFTLPPLPYGYDALEPHIDKMTMEIHHAKHHQGYVNNLNKAIEVDATLKGQSLEMILSNISKLPAAVRNNGGGHYNHSLFWTLMGKTSSQTEVPNNALTDSLKSSFGSLEEFKTKFSDAAMKRFGSGWAWLVVKKDQKLEICSTPNQDNPLMDISEIKGIPVLALDVWEHAYYLKNQNKRADYIASWWNVVNWEEASKLFAAAVK